MTEQPAPLQTDSRWSLWLLVVAGVAGLTVFFAFLDRLAPQGSADLRLTRDSVMVRSAEVMRGLGFAVDGLQQDAWFVYDNEDLADLQMRGGIDFSNIIARADTLPMHEWYVSWYDRKLSVSQNKDRYDLRMSPEGRLIGFEHIIRDSAYLPSVSADSARALAEQVLLRYHSDFTGYAPKTSSEANLQQRRDHLFVYARKIEGMELLLNIRVQGNEVGYLSWTSSPIGESHARFVNMTTLMTYVYTASLAVAFLLFFFIVVLFLKKYHEGEVGTRTASVVFLAYIVIGFLGAINDFRALGTGLTIGDLNKYDTRLVYFVLYAFIVRMFLGVLVFAAWSVGESSSRTVWPEKLSGMDSLLHGDFLSVDVAWPVVRGYAWGFLFLGLNMLVMFWFDAARAPLSVSSLLGLPESSAPGLQPVLAGLSSAVWSEIVVRMFFLSFLREKLHRKWLALPISVLVWCACSCGLWESPLGDAELGSQMLIIAAYGIGFALLMLRYDFLTAIVAHAVVNAFGSAIPLFTSSGNALMFARIEFAAAMMIPLVVAGVGFVRGKRFTFTADNTPSHVRRISERVRMAKELEIARNVQMGLLPKEQPKVAGYDIAGFCLPALEVGGDYFDFVSLGPGKIGIALGDVSGKGVPAAIYMTLTKGILQSHAEEMITPRSVLTKVNNLMYRTIERNSFVSMLYAVLDVGSHRLTFARAGQCPVVFMQDARKEGALLTPKGIALGLESGPVFDAVLEEIDMALAPGQAVVLYTDGFTEAMNEKNQEFGDDRLMASIRAHGNCSSEECIRRICDDVRAFAGDLPQHDDMTMVVIKRL